MQVRILGAAAGGGLPQWNCCCPNCRAVREDSPNIQSRTQSSVAISADGKSWFLLNVSPDIRHQISSFSGLSPTSLSGRATPIAGCVLTDGEIDHTTGLLLLREGCSFSVYSTAIIKRWLGGDYPIAPIVAKFAERSWRDLPLGESVELKDGADLGSGLWVRAIEMVRDVPRFVDEAATSAVGSVIALSIEDKSTGGTLVYAPGLGELNADLREAGEQASAILVDGTFWTDDEPRSFGITEGTAAQMGHIPVSGSAGSLAWLKRLRAERKIYVHINNTNPMLMTDGPEHAEVLAAGVQVGKDGDGFEV